MNDKFRDRIGFIFSSSEEQKSFKYKLGQCEVADCGCITELKQNDGTVWLCPDHTKQ